MFQVDSFIAIINPNQSASIAVGSVTKQPVVRDGQVAIADIMQCTISADHRVVNGAEAAQFVNEIKSHLENPPASSSSLSPIPALIPGVGPLTLSSVEGSSGGGQLCQYLVVALPPATCKSTGIEQENPHS